MLLAERVRTTAVLAGGMALAAALLGGCQDDGSAAGARPAAAARPTTSATSSTTARPSAKAAAAVPTPKDWPAGLPAPTADLSDAASLKAYLDSLTPAQKKAFGEAIRQGMSAKDRAELDKAERELEGFAPGRLKECTELVLPGATAASLALTAPVDHPDVVHSRLQMAEALDQLVKDADLAARPAKDVTAMAAAIRRHASDGAALVKSAQFTSALDDITTYVKQTCHPRK